GGWAAQVGGANTEQEALALYDRVRAAGYPVRIRPQAAGDGSYRYLLLVPQLATLADAEAVSARLRLALGAGLPQALR
ncbi:MAG: hypothetical protein QG619_2477, partial [Pseudomonadota bacterium]|nr:hypothetical protein [Pseudomonadota bacterium]